MKSDTVKETSEIPRASNLSRTPATTTTISAVPETKSPLTARPQTAKNQHRRKRRWLPYAGALVLIGLIAAGLWPEPAAVEMAKAQVGHLRATVNEEGKTRIKQRFMVCVPVPGQLRRVPFKAGADVKGGETVVAIIEPVTPTMLDARARSLAVARRDTAAAMLEKARAANSFAASELRRVEVLAAEGISSKQDLENVQARETATQKELAAAESALRQAEAELAEFTIPPITSLNPSEKAIEVKAPVSGRVLRVFEESSRVLQAGAPILEIGDPLDLEIVIEVLSRDGAAITPGTKVYLEQWGAGAPLEARVRYVEPAAFTKISALGVEEQRVNIIADFVTPPEQRAGLGDAFRVEARIVIWEAANILKVPSGALFRQGQNWAVFVFKNGRAELRRVETGRSSGTEAQILNGLQAGEEVILYPGDRIKPNARVKRLTI
jgi:HlyD family secretion protein